MQCHAMLKLQLPHLVDDITYTPGLSPLLNAR